MCGINGIIYQSYNEANQRQQKDLQVMNSLIVHRGPDEEGVYASENVLMGIRRLSIIDIEGGHQPMHSNARNIAIVFNGEIYNYKQLKAGLIQNGVSFNTESDTEVVLKMYEIYGADCVNHLNGMFAFSIHDKTNNTVFIARDRFGEKPLYYSCFQQKFMWASELKSIIAICPELKHVSIDALNCYFALTFIPAPLTIYSSVFKLKAGYTLTINTQTLAIKEKKYWDIELAPDKNIELLSYENAQSEVTKILTQSVQQEMISDVPLGVFLSGGVDSSIVAALMANHSDTKIKTFSVGYENKRFDESDRAQLIAKHINSEHYQYTLSYNEILNSVNQVILNFDEPFADSSALPTYFVSQHARKEVKVALTGDGGDEVFGGYNKYLIHNYGNIYRNMFPSIIRNQVINKVLQLNVFSGVDSKSLPAKLRKFVTAVGENLVETQLNIIALGFRQYQLSSLLSSDTLKNYKQILSDNISLPDENAASRLKIARYIDKQISLEGDMLVKVDRVSMLSSLECRAPFLDPKLMELTYQMPDGFLLKGNNKKRILKDTFSHLMPPNFFNAPKKGFEVPIGTWLRNELKEDLLDTLSFHNLNKHFYFNTKYVKQLIDDHLTEKTDNSHKIWTLYCFQKWYNAQ